MFYNFLRVAEIDDLVSCLNLLGDRPVKLVANDFFGDESQWDTIQWSFQVTQGKVTDKKLLPNPEDSFQFSVANESSKQDLHVHEKVYEIYVAPSGAEVDYCSAGSRRSAQVSKGVLIVPPNLPHKVKLFGPTFVFQAATQGGAVDTDRRQVRCP